MKPCWCSDSSNLFNLMVFVLAFPLSGIFFPLWNVFHLHFYMVYSLSSFRSLSRYYLLKGLSLTIWSITLPCCTASLLHQFVILSIPSLNISSLTGTSPVLVITEPLVPSPVSGTKQVLNTYLLNDWMMMALPCLDLIHVWTNQRLSAASAMDIPVLVA